MVVALLSPEIMVFVFDALDSDRPIRSNSASEASILEWSNIIVCSTINYGTTVLKMYLVHCLITAHTLILLY